MARITVDDALENITNRFDLTLVTAMRARQIASGATPHIENTHDKPTVLALREIAAGYITKDILNVTES